MFKGEGERNNNLKSFVIPQKFVTEIIETCKKEIKTANEINFSSLKTTLSDDEYELFMSYAKQLANTGVFIVKENKKLMIDTIKEILKQGGNLKAFIEKSIKEQELWICDNRLGVKALNNLWNMLESQFKAKEAKEQQKIIEISHKYKESIQEFIAYRNSKGRYFNSFALNKFLLELAKFEYLKIDIVSAINQSIERGYNWVFKPTHRNRFFNRKAKKVA